MFALRMVQAAFGDCLILEYGTAKKPRFMLIDGGPNSIFDDHLSVELQRIQDAGGELDLVVLSHVDNDHILGLLDFTSALRAEPEEQRMKIGGLWHNAFSQTFDPDAEIVNRVRAASAGSLSTMRTLNAALLAVGEGSRLRADATILKIPVNEGFAEKLVSFDTAPAGLAFGNVTITVVGPTKKNLEALRVEWLKWLEKHEDAIATGDPQTAAMADKSIPNLSSIQLHVEADGKTMLLTGDGRGDHLLEGLEAAGLLDADGGIDVDLLKLPHHGSDRDVTAKFFERVRAKTYAMSANGRDGNPDIATLHWIVETAKKQEREIALFATNATPSTAALLKERPPGEFPYSLTIMSEPHSHLVEPL